jgi:protein-tyrosine phosphatase
MTPSLAEPGRHLRLPGTRNLRDVGGYPAAGGRRTRWRTLLRTDALDVLPSSSRQVLIDLGLRTVIDLRWPNELLVAPSVFATDPMVRYHSVSLLEDDPVAVSGLPAIYRLMLDERSAQLAEVARLLLEDGATPSVVGCTAGKDRTGVTVAVLLAAIGVPDDVIVADYELTAAAFARPAEPDPDPYLADWRASAAELECPRDLIQGTLEHLDRRHGGADGLLRRHGFTAGELERLAERLTEAG